jgi:hypothetical protein
VVVQIEPVPLVYHLVQLRIPRTLQFAPLAIRSTLRLFIPVHQSLPASPSPYKPLSISI